MYVRLKYIRQIKSLFKTTLYKNVNVRTKIVLARDIIHIERRTQT